jgi:hypothetical protein
MDGGVARAERVGTSALGPFSTIVEHLASGMAMSAQLESGLAMAAQAGRPQAGAASHLADIPLDAWLRHALHQSFGTILGEPLPAELERLASGTNANVVEGAELRLPS